jgi:hypothetical protein
MRVILFQDRFADKVRNGDKFQTIRQSARCTGGDTLSLRRWTGKPYRSKQEILRTAKCSYTIPVQISERGVWSPSGEMDRAAAAWADGFDCWEDMLAWFKETHGLPFVGDLIVWAT